MKAVLEVSRVTLDTTAGRPPTVSLTVNWGSPPGIDEVSISVVMRPRDHETLGDIRRRAIERAITGLQYAISEEP